MKGCTNTLAKNGEKEILNITLNTNQLSHTDIIGTTFTISYGEYSKTYKWTGDTVIIDIPAFIEYTISFGEIEGYLKPSDITYMSQIDNSRNVTFTYKTELVQVSLSSDNGDSVNGAIVKINGASYTWGGAEITHKVPFGVVYTIELGDLAGFSTPYPSKSYTAGQAVRELSFTYISSALKISILSNQDNDSVIAAVKAQVYQDWSADSDGSDLNLIGEIGNNESITLPEYSQIYIKFPEVEGYKTPEMIHFSFSGGLEERSVIYQCELLTVNVSADEGTPSGYEVSVMKGLPLDMKGRYKPLSYIETYNEASGYIDCEQGFPLNSKIEIHGRASLDRQVLGYLFGGHEGSLVTDAVILYFSGPEDSCIYYQFGVSDTRGRCEGYINPGEEFWINIDKYICNIKVKNDQNEREYLVEMPEYGVHDTNNDGQLGWIAFFGESNVDSSTNDRVVSDTGIDCILYSAKVYDGDTLVHDYVPAKDLGPVSTEFYGDAGLYDRVKGRFFGYRKYITGDAPKTVATGTTSAGLRYEENSMVVGTQNTPTGTYKLSYDKPYYVRAKEVEGYKTPAIVTRTAFEKYHIINQEYKIKKVIDLSLQDVYGNPINRSTANCYIVREPGQYKFPLVYGNAIKNGKINYAAFTNNGGTNSHDFVNGENVVITQPYLYEDISNVVLNIINNDTNDVISNVSVVKEDGIIYGTFTINNVPSSGGNIILRSANGMYYRWSWHIWLWPHDLTPVEITNSTGVKYNIMPVNLASKYDSDGVHIKNWFYQWGRPNPMLLPSAWNSTTDHSPGSITKSLKANKLYEGITYPTTFYYNSDVYSNGNWFGDKSYYNLWDAACTDIGNSDNDTVKTVYDPCPVGWKVPNGNTFTGLSVISESNGIVKFSRYSGDTVGVEFPMSGRRGSTIGCSLNSVGSAGDVWLSSAKSQGYAYHLALSSVYGSILVYPQYDTWCMYGQSVRPVEDDNIQLDVIMINFTLDGVSYQAESGMTWFEWVNSEYNTIGYKISSYGDRYILTSKGNFQLVEVSSGTYITYDMPVKAVKYRTERYVS